MKILTNIFASLGLTMPVFWLVVLGGREMFGVEYETVAFFAAIGTFAAAFFAFTVERPVAVDFVQQDERDAQEEYDIEAECDVPDEDSGTPLCTTCLAPAGKLQHFCDQCGSPMTSHAAIDPVGQVLSVGQMVSKATSSPPRRIIVIGIWLIFGVPIAWVMFVFGVMDIVDSGGSLEQILRTAFLLGMFSLYIAIIIKTTRNYFRKKSELDSAPGDDEKIADEV
jgi:hypothetical protein